MGTQNVEEMADALVAKFGTEWNRNFAPQEVEETMRPYGVISRETQRALALALLTRKAASIDLHIACWIEANEVVSGENPKEKERRIRMLMLDTCECVLEHLEAAVAHATSEVDSRVLSLLKHPYFTKEKPQ